MTTLPRAAWFAHTKPENEDFPLCPLREARKDEVQQRLCDLISKRGASLQGLSRPERYRLEQQTASSFVLDVERFYPLYPEAVDSDLLNVARVAARMRRAAAN